MLSSLILSLAMSTSPVPVIESDSLMMNEIGIREGKVRIGIREGKVRIGIREGKVRIGIREGKVRI
ncbi:MAG: hypothetical protein ACJA0T_001130 [Colwellia sp.]|jgi:hypothetical protein